MDKKDKDLLIKDFSARVFYGVKVNIERDFPNNPQIVERIGKDGEIIVNGNFAYDIYYYKPYLRPMDSMTEEEENEYRAINCYEGLFPRNEDALDYVLSHHLDFRGLIEKGLALEAPEDMYKTE